MRHSIRKWLSVMFLLAGLGACKESPKAAAGADINTMVSQFSDLECRAFMLREERYHLADKIRFTEDSIIKIPDNSSQKKNLQSQLTGYLKYKETILATSLRLADTIKQQLDTIIKIRLQSKDKIDRFDKALSIELQKRHCGK